MSRWKRWVGWYMALSGAGTLLWRGEEGLTFYLAVAAWTMWGAWWVLSNPPADGYLVARAWRALPWVRRRRDRPPMP